MPKYEEEGIFVKAGKINFLKSRIAIEINKRKFRKSIGKD
jgi:hypothetical protein